MHHLWVRIVSCFVAEVGVLGGGIPSFAMAGVKLICGLLLATTLLGCCNGGPDGLLRGYVAGE